MILHALADQVLVGKIENASQRQVLSNGTYASRNCITDNNNTNKVQIETNRETRKQEKKQKQKERKKEELKEKRKNGRQI